MIISSQIASSRSQELNDLVRDHITKEYYKRDADHFSFVAKANEEKDPHEQAPPKKRIDRYKKHLERFKEWIMPDQPEAYIKAKKNGLL
jgi:hypothetical protein